MNAERIAATMRVRAAWDNLGIFMIALKFTRNRL